MTKLRNNDGSPLHRAVPELGREGAPGASRPALPFLRTVSLLGVSVASAKAFLAGTEGGLGFSPQPALAQEPKRGGTFRMAMQTQEITDPANYNWIEASDITRNIIEYLTLVDEQNVTHPYLAASWTPSDDLKVWSFRAAART